MRLSQRSMFYGLADVGFVAIVLILDLMFAALGNVCEFLLRPAAMLTRHDILTLALGLVFESILWLPRSVDL